MFKKMNYVFKHNSKIQLFKNRYSKILFLQNGKRSIRTFDRLANFASG
ncbi:hypothetical protein LEP1GSC111_3263 [Leptospira interrogans str. UT126]|nr:hypothetical protein LEP1GSC111_3263 [Leptospira interrogans str. UT126]EMN53000.1 hypothetical protein LEP1GSC089_2576 [Leptospira interrogans serovar Autumnalis str. LP101]